MMRVILLVVLLVFNFQIIAQLVPTKTIDIIQTQTDEDPDYFVLSLENKGLLLIEHFLKNEGNKGTNWGIKKLSTSFELEWKNEVTIEYSYNLIASCLTQEGYYQLFNESGSEDIKISKTNLSTGDQEWVEGKLVGVQEVRQMKVIGDMAYISGKFQGRDVIVGFSIHSKTNKALPGLYSNYMEVVEIEHDTVNSNLLVYTKHKYKKKCELQLRTYTPDGSLLTTSNLENESRKLPFTARLNHINKDQSIIIGNYARFCDSFSQGIYVQKLDDGQIESSKFIDFAELNNFFNYLSPRKQKRIKTKIEAKKQLGKKMNFNYNMLVHKLYQNENELLLVAEVFYVEPRNTAGLQVYGSGRNFSLYNYRFTHAIVIAFDKNGNKLWDNCLSMKNLSSYYNSEQVQLSMAGKNIILAYPEDGKIKTQLIEQDKNIKEMDVYALADTGKEIWDTDLDNGLLAWHGQHYLAWGYKTIRVTENSMPVKVFQINKLTYKL